MDAKRDPNIPFPLPVRIDAVDIGSTCKKVAAFSYEPDTGLTVLAEGWEHYQSLTRVLPDGTHTRLLTNTLLQEISNTLEATRKDFSEKFGPAHILVVTGLTNSLVAVYGFSNAVFLDDPSLTTDSPPSEDLQKIYGLNFSVPKISTLMKIVALQKNPDLIRDMFGKFVTFSDLLFTTLVGIITYNLTQGSTGLAVPLDDLRGLGSHDIDPDMAEKVMIAAGLGRTQASARRMRLIPTPERPVFQINDFAADLRVLSMLFNNQTLEEDAIVISLDSIGKVIAKGAVFSKSLAGISYDTQRMTGRIMTTWMQQLLPQDSTDKPVLPSDDNRKFYEELDAILDQSEPAPSLPFAFIPAAYGNEGVLVSTSNGSETRLNELGTLPETDRQQAITAIAYGVGYGLRHIVDRVLNSETPEKPPVYLYGGLGSHNQVGWRKILARVFTSYRLSWLEMPSSALAAAHAALIELGWEASYRLTIGHTDIPPETADAALYAQWKDVAEKFPDK